MIQDRNIANNAGIFPGKIAGYGCGDVFYVYNAADTAVGKWLNKRVKKDHLFTSIIAALAKTVSARNDYVIVYPSATDYDEGATLTMNKDNVHLLCPAGLGGEYGAGARAATIDPNVAAHAITISGRGVEVAGFWIRGYTEKYCITDSGTGTYIHHNDCAITCTTAVAGGIYVAGTGAKIERNFIFSNAGSGTWLFGIAAIGAATRTQARKNVITVGNASTCTCGINFAYDNGYMQMGVIADNYLIEVPDCGGGVGTATLTKAISGGAGTFMVNNRVAMATVANSIVGGTADKTASCNFDSLNGGAVVQDVD